uniref:hypothetical protein n=1 Tax=Porodaedalea mongolica TaxID=2651638 RepID=UPI0021AC5AF7|nr:hypothetical protein NYK79_mgp20 [Porodaedalea mongolica]UUA03970.1 hypothetical protein [Porodaedalea mongolica]WCF76737.1 hypothetical protein [Porodaedalea mongolica]
MIIKTITPRKTLSIRNLRENIDLFIRQTRQSSQHVVMQINLSYNGKNETLSKKLAMDLNNKKQIKTLRDIATKNFNKIAKDKTELYNTQIFIYYRETTEEAYNNFNDSLSMNNKKDMFDIDDIN